MPSTPYQRRRRSYRPRLEILEKREVPAVLTVTNLLDNGAGSLRAEVASAQDGDTVQFADGLSGQITLTSGEIAINHSIAIEGPGADVITISGNHASRVFDIAATFTVIISALTIANGQAPIFQDGGGIYNAGMLTIANSTLTGNSAYFASPGAGGGILNTGTLAVTNSTLTGNSAAAGGAIANSIHSTLTVTNSTLSGNSNGGGISSSGGTVTITGCIISGNATAAGYSGGGISIGDGTATITGSILSNNSTMTYGGGIFNAGMLTVIGTTLSGNASTAGGGVYNVGTLSVADSILGGNSVASDFLSAAVGGGIANVGNMLTVSDSTFRGNSVNGELAYGGGIYNSSISTLTVTASTFIGNSASGSSVASGGGIANSFGTLTVTGSAFNGNSATEGGGIYSAGIGTYGTLTVSASTFSANSASSDGGGISAGGMVAITSSTLTGNSAGIEISTGTTTITDCTLAGNSGPGINNYNGTVVITGCILTGNSTSGAGGGILNAATATIIDSTISGNSAVDGGGIDNRGTLTLTRSILSSNSASNAGGGGIANLATATVSDSTISGNAAYSAGGGGGIENVGTLTLTSSTLSGNSASNGGGIFQIPSATATVQNTIIAGNSAPLSPDVSGLLTSGGHNLFGDGTGGTGFLNTDLVGTHTNPIDPLLGPLQDNGGPTQTMALLVGSPAIAAGDITDAPPTDQRGAPRIVNGTIDIGAYEVQSAPAPSCSVAQSLLWPPNHQLINVGFSVQLNADADPSTQVSVQVYANDNANASDAADIGPDTLQLRSERQGHGRGRVYLIVATATDASGQTGFDVCTVVVPHDQSARSLAEVQTEAATAAAYYQDFQTAPAGYALLGEGPVANGYDRPSLIASLGEGFRLIPVARVNPPTTSSQWPTFRIIPVADPTGEMLAAGTVAPVDGYFAAAHEEPFQLRWLRSKMLGGDNEEMVIHDISLDFMTADSWSE